MVFMKSVSNGDEHAERVDDLDFLKEVMNDNERNWFSSGIRRQEGAASLPVTSGSSGETYRSVTVRGEQGPQLQ